MKYNTLGMKETCLNCGKKSCEARRNENNGCWIPENHVEIIQEEDFDGKITKVTIKGLELKPYWKRFLLILFPWKNPIFIFTNPKIVTHDKRGRL